MDRIYATEQQKTVVLVLINKDLKKLNYNNKKNNKNIIINNT